jgi:hypothetical protein
LKKVKNPPTTYEEVLEDESIYDFAQCCGDFRDAMSIMPSDDFDPTYQYLFDRVIDALIVAYDSGGIETTISGIRKGMHQRRKPIPK